MQRTLKGLLFVLVCLFTIPAVPAQQSPPPQPPSVKHRTKDTKAILQEAIPDLMRKANIPGLQIALLENGKTSWLGEFGQKNVTTHQPVTPDTIFEAASLSKPVFAFGVLKLVDQGKLDLDVPLTTYLPKPYIDGDDRLKLITARIVLSHRTGFPNWRGDSNALTIRFTPGSRFSYSGEGFVYLQKVVEQITGKPLNDFMAETVFVPLHMKSSSYVWRPDFDDRTATGHDADQLPRDKRKPADANAASSLHTTAADFALFLQAVLNGTGLKRQTLRLMESPQIAVDPSCTNCTERSPKELSHDLFWGLGWGIAHSDRGDILWHWGDNGAFKCFVAINPRQKKGVVFFTDSENGLSIAEEIMRIALAADPPIFHWLKYDSYDSTAMRFSVAVREKGATAAIAEFTQDLKAGTISEDSLNSTGYRLLREKKSEDAIQVFELNVQLHPNSANAYDSLGEAYMDKNDVSRAISNYEHSLQLNPNNNNALEMLKKLRSN